MTPTDRYEIGSVRFALDDPDASVVRESVPGHGYEPGVTAILRSLLRRGGRSFVDIGSLYGYFALYAAKLNPACKVFAVEPHPVHFEVLTANVAANRVDVSCHPLAFSDENGEVAIHGKALQGESVAAVGALRSAGSGLRSSLRGVRSRYRDPSRPSAGRGQAGVSGRPVTWREWGRESMRQCARALAGSARTAAMVPTVPYDSWAEGRDLRETVVKVDVHGAEGLVLAGMSAALQDHVESVLVEVHNPRMMIGHGPHEVLEMLRNAGFDLYEVADFRTSGRPVLLPLRGERYRAFADATTWSLGELALMRMVLATKETELVDRF